MEKRLLRVQAKERDLLSHLPYEFIKEEKRMRRKEVVELENKVRRKKAQLESLKRTTGMQQVDYQRHSGNVRARKVRDSHDQFVGEHGKELSEPWQKRFEKFARAARLRGVSVGLKSSHSEGNFDVGVYLGENIQGWFGLEYNPRFGTLCIESVQGKYGRPKTDFVEMTGVNWAVYLAKHIARAVLRNGERKIMLIDYKHQPYAQKNKDSIPLYRMVDRVLRQLSSKRISVQDGKYHIYLLKEE